MCEPVGSSQPGAVVFIRQIESSPCNGVCTLVAALALLVAAVRARRDVVYSDVNLVSALVESKDALSEAGIPQLKPIDREEDVVAGAVRLA